MRTGTVIEQYIRLRVRTKEITPLSGRNQRYHLHYFGVAVGMDQEFRVDRNTIRRWLEAIARLSVGTRRAHVSSVRMFLRYAASEGLVSAKVLDLIPKVRTPRAVPRALSRGQVTALLESLSDDRARVIVGLMLWAGLRCGEVANLRVEDVDEQGQTLFIRGKGGHERIVCIPDEFAPVLTRWLDWRRRVPGPLVLGRRGASYTTVTLSRSVSIWMRTAGVKVSSRDGRSAHALRHTAASDVLDRGASITTVQAMLGHAHLATTAIYLRRARLEDLRTAMNGRTYGRKEEGAA